MRTQFAIVLLAVVAGCWTMKAGSDVHDGGPLDATSVRDGTMPSDIAAQADAAADATDVTMAADVVDASAPGDVPVTGDMGADAMDAGVTTDVPTGTDVPVVDAAVADASTAPRQIAPLSTATVTSQNPTLHWVLATGTDGAHVQVCRDRPCMMVEQTYDVTGTRAAVPSTLTPGVHYWHLASRTGTTVGTTWSATWEFIVGHRSATVDTSGVATDLNGDGYADVIAGEVAPVGSVYEFFGSSGGLSLSPNVIASPLVGDGGTSYFGFTVAIAGDVNGDGFADALVGEQGGCCVPAVFLFLGGASGLTTSTVSYPADGQSFSGAGDVNGDGFADIVVGGTNAAFLYLGGAGGPSSLPTATLLGPTGSDFGAAVASAGDVNGDGYGDVLVAAYSSDTVFLYFGGAAGLTTSPTMLFGPVGTVNFGLSLASAGDVNGDGLGDVVIGSESRTASVYLGSAGSFSTTPTTLVGPLEFGVTVAGVGDVNGDGYADLVVAGDTVLEVFVYLGGPGGLATSPLILNPPTGSVGANTDAVSVGDLNGDGYADILVYASPGVYVFLGSARGLVTTPVRLPDPSGSPGFGQSVASTWHVPSSTLIALSTSPQPKSRTRNPPDPCPRHS